MGGLEPRGPGGCVCPRGRGPAEGMRKDALGGRIDHAMAWAFIVKERGRFVGEGACKAIACGGLAKVRWCSDGVCISMFLDGLMVIGRKRPVITGCLRGWRRDSPAVPDAKTGPQGAWFALCSRCHGARETQNGYG